MSLKYDVRRILFASQKHDIGHIFHSNDAFQCVDYTDEISPTVCDIREVRPHIGRQFHCNGMVGRIELGRDGFTFAFLPFAAIESIHKLRFVEGGDDGGSTRATRR